MENRIPRIEPDPVAATATEQPLFDVRKHYQMTIESRGRTLAVTTFWLLGKGAQYSGKVEFSDQEAKGKQ